MLPRILCSALALLVACAAAPALAAPPALPSAVEAALARARIPQDAVALLVQEAGPEASPPRLAWRTQAPMNPASVMKLATTYAALDLLGPAFAWTTPVYLEGPVREGVLQGNVYVKGQGDPKLVLERLWLLLRRLQGLGIQRIAGDIVLDHSAFALAETDPAGFDGEPLRPYNAAPDALLLNYKSVLLGFTPDPTRNLALIQLDPPLAGVQVSASVPLVAGECGDYRAALKADFSDPNRIRFAGSYPASCGEKAWPVAYAEPRSYAARAVQGLWQAMGGQLGGSVHAGTVPPALLAGKPAFETVSPPLAEVIRDINKYSNNVMAQQLFLTLGRLAPAAAAPAVQPDAPMGDASAGVALPGATLAMGQAAMQRWWRDRLGTEDMPTWDNGSGLSRNERMSARALGRLLQLAWRSPLMPELMASLPISGVDGTLRRFKSAGVGSAHLKTGSLSNVLARAGYVDGASGKRYVLVALVNHANANTEAARAAMEALLDWTVRDN